MTSWLCSTAIHNCRWWQVTPLCPPRAWQMYYQCSKNAWASWQEMEMIGVCGFTLPPGIWQVHPCVCWSVLHISALGWPVNQSLITLCQLGYPFVCVYISCVCARWNLDYSFFFFPNGRLAWIPAIVAVWITINVRRGQPAFSKTSSWLSHVNVITPYQHIIFPECAQTWKADVH